MKKTFIILTSLLLICIMLIGCNSTDATIQASKELNKNLNLLYNTVNRLDTIDNEYLVSNDIYELNKITTASVPTPNRGRTTVLAQAENIEPSVTYTANDNLQTDEISLKDDLTQALKNELVNRLYCDNNGNCKLCKNKYTCGDNGVCNSCKQTVICDSNGNCTSCKNTLILDNNNNCSSCKKSCVTTMPNTNLTQETKSCLQKISANSEKLNVQLLSTDNQKLVADKLENDTNLNYLQNNDIVSDNKSIDNVNNDTDDHNININENQENFDNTNIRDLKTTTEETIVVPQESTEITTTKVDNSNENHNTDEIKNAETITSSSDDNNTIISDTTIDNVQPTDEISDDSNKTSDNQIKNEPYKIIYYSESSFTPDYLRYNPRFISNINYDSANTSLGKYVEKLQKLYTMTADVVEANNTLANYKIIIIDNIQDAKELNDCVLTGNCTPTYNQVMALNNYIEDMKTTIKNLRNANGSLTNEINKISSTNTGIAQSIDIANSNYLKILNQIDTRISYHENAIATLEQIKYLLQDAQNSNNNSVVIEDLNNAKTNQNKSTTDYKSEDKLSDENKIDRDTIIESSQVDNSNLNNANENTYVVQDKLDNQSHDNIQNNDIDNTENNDLVNNTNSTPDSTPENTDNVLVEDKIETNDNVVTETRTYKNIDTYNNTNGNVDTYRNELRDSNNNISDGNILNNTADEVIVNDNSTLSNDNVTDNKVLPNNNLTNNDLANNDLANNETTIVNPNNTPQMVDNNNIVTDGTTNNTGIVDNNFNAGLNNGFDNTIISQNNLDNNDLGNNSYRYDGNGTLYNNTNGYNNGGINNVNERNNNVNTYKYNTLIDSINRGTVNNGINTLKVSA